MAQQNIRRSSSREPAESWPPLVCICNLCECGGHKCSDFNEWLAASRDGGSTTPLDDQQQDGSSRMRPSGECCNAGPPGHSCNYTRAGGPLDERFLTTTRSTNHQASGQQQQREQEHLQLRSKRSASQPDGAANEPAARSVTPASKGQTDGELLRVLVTRPQVASRPRDNIIFEGDMDLRTTFEMSYEALARTRLEHWKRHQELRAAAGQRSLETPAWRQDVSDTNGQRAETVAAATGRRQGAGLEGRPADEHGSRTWAQLGGGDVDGAAIDASGSSGGQSLGLGRARDESARNHRPPSNATMIKPPSRLRSPLVDQSAQSKQERRPLVFGPALGLERANGDMADGSQQRQAAGTTSPSQAAALTTGQRKQQQHRRQQDHFIDPDLSPIIVYDANLNRLERVGLRKRSKYRPSTSLRPGGGGFFGPEEKDRRGPEMAAATTRPDPTVDHQINADDDRSRSEWRPEERGANPNELDEAPSAMEPDGSAPPAANGSSHQLGTTTAKAAGASSETLNRAQVDCGRKHHLGHVNRIDHIRQLNLVESSPSSELAAASSIAMAYNGDTGIQRGQQQPGANEDDDEQRRLAQEEEAAVAEIQRLVVGDDEYRVAHRIEPPPAMRSSSRQSNRLIKQATIASPSEAAARAQANSPASNQAGGGGRSSSRQLRMERVCQNQSFYLFENDYPETRNGALDNKRCIKIGGRETVELPRQRQHVASPQSAHVRQNLFRESPDFIMTTGRGGGKRASLHTTDGDEHQMQPDQQQEQHQMQNAQNGSPGPDQAKVQEQHDNIIVNQTSDHSVNRRGDSPSDPHQCRVLNLGHDFEFVGSRAGHRYFVEKHIMATPISEVS